nr:hypothetical protein [Chordicoccus furentiruminis]
MDRRNSLQNGFHLFPYTGEIPELSVFFQKHPQGDAIYIFHDLVDRLIFLKVSEHLDNSGDLEQRRLYFGLFQEIMSVLLIDYLQLSCRRQHSHTLPVTRRQGIGEKLLDHDLFFHLQISGQIGYGKTTLPQPFYDPISVVQDAPRS